MDWLRRLLGGRRARSPQEITCMEAAERLLEFLDGELEEVSHEEVEAHLDVCQKCFPRLQFEKAFREVVRGARRGRPAPSHVRDRVLEVLGEEGHSSS